jgi:hypothetical protein
MEARQGAIRVFCFLGEGCGSVDDLRNELEQADRIT